MFRYMIGTRKVIPHTAARQLYKKSLCMGQALIRVSHKN